MRRAQQWAGNLITCVCRQELPEGTRVYLQHQLDRHSKKIVRPIALATIRSASSRRVYVPCLSTNWI